MGQVQLPGIGEVREAHVDWLTATANDQDGRRHFGAHAPPLIGAEVEAGNKLAPWRWQDYTGWHAGGCSFGERPDSHLVRLSGSVAARSWRVFGQTATNVSRLDLAVTVKLDDAGQELATHSYAAALRSAHERGAELSCSLLVNSDGGATCYLGARASDKFGRLYDKGRESEIPEYTGCWRYEVELKRRPAFQCARWLLGQADEATAVREYVWRYWNDRGVRPLFPRGRRLALPEPVPRQTDNQRRLLWLHDQVRPAVEGLLAAGQQTAVLQALGLITDPRERLS